MKYGNQRNVDLDEVNEIEKYVKNHITSDNELKYELLCRFILLEHNGPLYDDEKCIKYLMYLLNKDIIHSKEYYAYFVILLAWIEDGFSEISQFTRKHIDKTIMMSNDLYIKSILYYIKAKSYECNNNGFENIIKLLMLSIESDKYATNSYLLLSKKYKEIGNMDLCIKYFNEGIKSIKEILSLKDLENKDMTDVKFIISCDIQGNIIDEISYKDIYRRYV